ncbi:MAG: phenylacetate--CoA ligase family protein [Pseudomonadota bacterium]
MLPPFDPFLSMNVAFDVTLATRADAAALAGRQQRRLAALLRGASRRSPLYRDVLRGRDPAQVPLQALPVMHKRALMQQFDRWVADPALQLDALRRFTADRQRIAEPFAGRYQVWESSGSSGEPGVFVQDAAALAVYDALEGVRRSLMRPPTGPGDPWFGAGRIVFVGAIEGHFASTVSLLRLRRLNPLLAQRLHSVSCLQPWPQLRAALEALAPAVVATYPSAAALLAEERLAGRLDLAVREVWTGGETLTPAARRLVEQAFGCRVVNNYGASEFLALGAECHAGGLHLNSDWAILEPVDAQGRPVPPGETGTTTLLTNLANEVQPLIRYDLGDRVTLLPGACTCGSQLPVIDVQGRSDDTLHLPGRGRQPVQVLPLALATVLEDDAGLFDFQLVQQGPAELLLRTGLAGEAARRALPRARRVLAAWLAQQGAAPVQIHCHSGEPARPGRSGKIQRVLCERAGA